MDWESPDNQSEWETPVSRENAGVAFMGVPAVFLVAT